MSVDTPSSLEDEKPNFARMAALALILVGLTGWLFWTRSHPAPPPPKPIYSDLPGVDTAGLTPQQLSALLRYANHTQCDCGLNNCTMNLAECRHLDPGCHTSRGKLTALVALVKSGKPLPPDGIFPPDLKWGTTAAPPGLHPGEPASAGPASASPAP